MECLIPGVGGGGYQMTNETYTTPTICGLNQSETSFWMVYWCTRASIKNIFQNFLKTCLAQLSTVSSSWAVAVTHCLVSVHSSILMSVRPWKRTCQVSCQEVVQKVMLKEQINLGNLQIVFWSTWFVPFIVSGMGERRWVGKVHRQIQEVDEIDVNRTKDIWPGPCYWL